MTCKNCGKEIDNNSKFCPYCGSKNQQENEYFNEVDNVDSILSGPASVPSNAENSSTSNNNSNTNSSSTKLSTGAIVAIVIGSVIAFLLIFVLPIVLLIGCGAHLTKGATNRVLSEAESIKTQIVNFEREDYNYEIEQYIDNSVNGSDVSSLISKIIDSNLSNIGNKGRFISIEVKNISGFSLDDELEEACKAANVNVNKKANNDSKKVNSAIEIFRTLKSKIKSSEKYKVTAEYNDDGYIYNIIIEEL